MPQPFLKTSNIAGKNLALIIVSLISAQTVAAPASINLSSLDGNNGTRMEGVLSGDFLGFSVSKTGDFNADGYDDFIIGAPNSAALPGSAYLIYGRANGLAFPVNLSELSINNEGFRIDGAISNSQLGAAVSDAGDLNDDGLADVIVGAPGESAAYVLFGKAGGYPNSIAISSLDGLNGFRIGGVDNGQSGYSVANAGDVNGDNINDIIVGNGAANVGAAYVLFGRHSAFPAHIDAATLNNDSGFRINSAAINQSSFLVSGAGDINNDGVDDMVIGSWSNAAAYVVFGQSTAFSATIDLSALNGNNGFTLNDGTVSSQLGSAVAGIGDINGDGVADLAIGAPMASTTATNNQAGKTYVVFGSSSGFAPAFNIANLNGSNGGFQIYGAATRDRSGWSVGGGDINGDGVADLLIGAPYSSYNGAASGTSYVVFGKIGGFSSPINLSGNTLMPNHLDGNNGFQLPGASKGQQSGWAIASGGDLNGDGIDDVLIGARLTSRLDGTAYLINSGTGYVFYGRRNDVKPPVTTINPDPQANAFGWNNSTVGLSINALDEIGGSAVQETRCAVNPATIPTGFNDLTTGSCGNTSIRSEGLHMFYAASIDHAGNQEIPVSYNVKLDLTPPVVSVTGVKNSAVYRRGKRPQAGCSTSDALSGVMAAATLTISGGNRKGIGRFTARCNGAQDQAGNTADASVHYVVQ